MNVNKYVKIMNKRWIFAFYNLWHRKKKWEWYIGLKVPKGEKNMNIIY